VVQYELTAWNFTGCNEENHKLPMQVVDLRAEIGKGTSGTRRINDKHSTATGDGTETLGG